MVKYELMHKNIACGVIDFDEEAGRITGYKDAMNGLSPFLGHADVQKIRKWWEMRAVPASRHAMQQVIQTAGCINTGVYLAKNLALSMTDTYWIRPVGLPVSYEDVSFSNLAAYHDGKIPYHNATSYDPNASLGGQMEKYWDLSGAKPVLVKESYKYFGQQSVNEVFASLLHKRQQTEIPFVEYTAAVTEDRGILSMCQAFTSEKVEFLSAYEILESRKNRNDASLYEEYIHICTEGGIPEEQIRDFMDYQTMTDFLLTNTDEHLMNFGILRGTDTMQLLSPAPIFDSGNSMFYSDQATRPYTRAEILAVPVTSFYKTEEKMLAKVQNRSLVKPDLLPSPQEVKEFFVAAGIPEQKAFVISRNYETKVGLFKEFQKGKTISLYKERQEEKKKQKQNTHIMPELQVQKFIVLCGVPGAGKTAEAKNIERDLALNGCRVVNSTELYPLPTAIKNIGLIFLPEKAMQTAKKIDGYQNCVTTISPSEIRKEVLEQYPSQYSENLVFLLADMRIKTALLSGASVIYDATNLEKRTREKYANLASEAHVQDRTLCVLWNCPENASSGIPESVLKTMQTSLVNSHPSVEEGWTRLLEFGKEKSLEQETEKE